MVPIGAISVLSIVMKAARNELSVVTLKIFKIRGVAETFKKISPPCRKRVHESGDAWTLSRGERYNNTPYPHTRGT